MRPPDLLDERLGGTPLLPPITDRMTLVTRAVVVVIVYLGVVVLPLVFAATGAGQPVHTERFHMA